MPQQQGLPAWVVLNQSNDTAASGMADVYTGFPYNAGGLVLGDYYDLTSQEAFRNCKPSVATLYCGRYRRIQVDSGATASNVKTGTIGLLPSQAAASIDIGLIGGKLPVSMNVVTSYDKAIGASGIVLRPVVFLNSITPGNFGWVQELGVATVLGAASFSNGSPAIGDLICSTGNSTGVVNDIAANGSGSSLTVAQYLSTIGVAFDIPFTNGLFRVLMQDVPVVQD